MQPWPASIGKLVPLFHLVVAQHWGVGDATWAMGDFDGDHVVGPRDAAMLAANWGYVMAEANTAVPEPSTLVLLLGLSLGLCLQRRR